MLYGVFGSQADVQEISGEAYIVFGIILFFWELLPTSLVVVFFRVQRPNQNLVKWHAKSTNSTPSDRTVTSLFSSGSRRDDQQPQLQLQSLFL